MTLTKAERKRLAEGGRSGPVPRQKIVHMAKLMRSDGLVSPVCAKFPKAINLKVATWTNRPKAATCSRCVAALRASGRLDESTGGTP